MKVANDLRYTKTHEWVRIEDNDATVGITDYAQEQLTDIVYVEMPEVGAEAVRGQEIGVVESCKIASELYAPVSGSVTAVNEQLADAPELVNNDPYGEGWILKIKMTNPSEADSLLDPKAYEAHVAAEQT